MGERSAGFTILMNYLLIDANNLACKAGCAYDSTTTTGVDTSIVFGFLSQFASIRSDFLDFRPIVIWDGGHDIRDRVSTEAVNKGLIKEAYKENRKRPGGYTLDSTQVRMLQEFLRNTNIPQIKLDGIEADDIAASYCQKYKGDSVVACITMDKDYYQLIDTNVFVVRRWKGEQEVLNTEMFVERYGVSPAQWVDVGALSGDDGDNIFGVPSIGEKTAIGLVAKHGDYMSAILSVRNRLSAFRDEYPDLTDESDWKELESYEARGNKVYDCCRSNVEFSGVALARERKQLKKVNRSDVCLAMYIERARIAYELKAMRLDVIIPDIPQFDRYDADKVNSLCDLYEFSALRKKLHLFKDLP